jgi:membrane protease YdiL (CAAX protease family)
MIGVGLKTNERNSPMATIIMTTRTATSSPLKRLIKAHPLVAYFVMAFAFMWIPVLPLALSRNAGVGLLPYDLPDALQNVLLILTVFSGPTLAAMSVTGVTEGRAGVKQLLKRIVQWRIGLRWYLVALLIMPSIWLLAYTVVVGLPLLAGAISHWSLLVTTFLPLVAFGMIIPAIDEEPGWRGFALPRLQQRYGPLVASAILGTLHGLWHIPAVFTALYGPLPFADLLPFILTAALATFLYTWVYNRARGSILIAMLMHAASNAASGWLTTLLEETHLAPPESGWLGYLVAHQWLNVIAFGTAALILIVVTRGRLGYQASQDAQGFSNGDQR